MIYELQVKTKRTGQRHLEHYCETCIAHDSAMGDPIVAEDGAYEKITITERTPEFYRDSKDPREKYERCSACGLLLSGEPSDHEAQMRDHDHWDYTHDTGVYRPVGYEEYD